MRFGRRSISSVGVTRAHIIKSERVVGLGGRRYACVPCLCCSFSLLCVAPSSNLQRGYLHFRVYLRVYRRSCMRTKTKPVDTTMSMRRPCALLKITRMKSARFVCLRECSVFLCVVLRQDSARACVLLGMLFLPKTETATLPLLPRTETATLPQRHRH